MPAATALQAGCEGVSAINTITSVMGVNLDTLRPEPCVEGFSTPGGYSSKAVRPIALAKVPRPLASSQHASFFPVLTPCLLASCALACEEEECVHLVHLIQPTSLATWSRGKASNMGCSRRLVFCTSHGDEPLVLCPNTPIAGGR